MARSILFLLPVIERKTFTTPGSRAIFFRRVTGYIEIHNWIFSVYAPPA